MSTRYYSVAEIDRMRAAISRKLPHTVTMSCDAWGGNKTTKVCPPDHYERVEDQLRTYMLNGTEPEELES